MNFPKLTIGIVPGERASLTVTAKSPQTAVVFITAPNDEEADRLLAQARQTSVVACQNWKPEETPDPEPEPERKSEKEIRNNARLENQIRRARDFVSKKNGSIGCLDFYYLVDFTRSNLWDGLVSTYNLAYRRGFDRAKREQRKQRLDPTRSLSK